MFTHALALVEKLLQENPQHLDINVFGQGGRGLGGRSLVRRGFRSGLGHLVGGRHFCWLFVCSISKLAIGHENREAGHAVDHRAHIHEKRTVGWIESVKVVKVALCVVVLEK